MTTNFGAGVLRNRIPLPGDMPVRVSAYLQRGKTKAIFLFNCVCEQTLEIGYGECIECSHCGRDWFIECYAYSEKKP